MTIFDDIGGAFDDVMRVTGSIVDTPPRTIKASVLNKTTQNLNWVDSGVDHGVRDGHAPDVIKPQGEGKWSLKNDGVKTGCEGWMKWRIGDNGPVVKLEYNNPFVGSNTYSCSVDSDDYVVQREGGTGDKATVKFTVDQILNQKPTAPVDDDSDSC
ncbi:hypothetical protein NW762_011717 [Fusarium torreyae]|uniref:Uncharacterized protein n=1 Tax=Fusarium torreyae TaxID=1237075 RepID=A0A9W8RSZ2_9HYPO|nr:hypothetical protein NW762_011717 [Fusarium torreyae]